MILLVYILKRIRNAKPSVIRIIYHVGLLLEGRDGGMGEDLVRCD